MGYWNNTKILLDNYFFARVLGRPSTAAFWYLPEIANVTDQKSLQAYKTAKMPFYLMNYQAKLKYSLKNDNGIIVLPYPQPIGNQVNPEAAFQYALALHDQYLKTGESSWLKQFWHYVDYFLKRQTNRGDWSYEFDWFESKAPWSSALAQARGASVMLRAWLHTQDQIYLKAAVLAFSRFDEPHEQGGYSCFFKPAGCYYFEEYPQAPTAVINGFMAALFGIWELYFWTKQPRFANLWQNGIFSLAEMLPHYTVQGWTLYDQDIRNGKVNLNSPRYHELMINYILILSLLSDDMPAFEQYYKLWSKTNRMVPKMKALVSKSLRKIKYR